MNTVTTQRGVRLSAINPKEAQGKTKELLDVVQAKLGLVPNLMRPLAHSPAALEAYLQFSGTLAKGVLDVKTREAIALVVAQSNSCTYCVSAHTFIGSKSGMQESEILESRKGFAADPKTAAILKFVGLVVKSRGVVNDVEVDELRTKGVSDAEIAEIVANISLNIYTNYFNLVAQTEVDFPRIQL